MKDTPQLRENILHRMHTITRNQLGISDFEFPIVFFSRRELSPTLKTSFYANSLGGCHEQLPVIWLNLPRIKNEDVLYDVILHELVHYRFCLRKHGVPFDKRFYSIKKGDKFRNVRMRFKLDAVGDVVYDFVGDVRKNRMNQARGGWRGERRIPKA